MHCNRWAFGVVVGLLGTFAQGQVPETVPSVKLPPAATGKEIPGAAELIERKEPFIARYAYCNAMQMYQSRRAAWEPIYRDAGASSADLDAYSGEFVTYFKEFCADGGPGAYWQDALSRVEAFDERMDRAMAASLGIEVADATVLRISRILAQLEELRARCLGGGQGAAVEDLVSAFASLLPASPQPPGMMLDRTGGAPSIGKCGPDGGTGSGGLGGRSLDRATLSSCIAAALEQASSCVSPFGDAPAGEVVRRDDFGAGCATIGKAEACTTAERRVYANGGYTEVRTRVVTTPDKNGHQHEVREVNRRTIGTDGETISEYTATFYDGVNTGITGTGDATADRVLRVQEDAAIRRGVDLTVPAGYRAVMEHFVSPNRRLETHTRRIEATGTLGRGGAAGRPRDCASVNPASAEPLGLARTAAGADDGGSPVHAGRLDPWDLVGQCVCNSVGRLGPGLAANSGFRCGPDENSRRLDCLLNPGPADGIRPECVGYLQDDNPGRDTRTTLAEWCGRIIQCPPGAALATVSDTGGATCSCGTGLATPAGSRGGTPGGGMCARVSCAGGAGAVGEDLYRQCCGAPGDLPIKVDPSSGAPVPRPPDPKQDPKQKSPNSP